MTEGNGMRREVNSTSGDQETLLQGQDLTVRMEPAIGRFRGAASHAEGAAGAKALR